MFRHWATRSSLTCFHCHGSVLHLEKTSRWHEAKGLKSCFSSWVSEENWSVVSRRHCRLNALVFRGRCRRLGVLCPSPSQRFHGAWPPPSPNITTASHLLWILSRSIATAHSHSIPFPFLQGPHKVNPNLFAGDGLIITLACLSLSEPRSA